MGVVALDVAALLANVFIKLIACEMHQADEPWVLNITKGLETLGLIFSCLFMVELGACLFAFGFRYVAILQLSNIRLTLTHNHSAIFSRGFTCLTLPSLLSAS